MAFGAWLERYGLLLLLLLAPFALAVLVWNRLPAELPIHWDAEGHPDAYLGKGFALILLPALNGALIAGLLALPSLDPLLRDRPERKQKLEGQLYGAAAALAVFLVHISFAVIYAALGNPINVVRVVTVGSLVLLFAAGWLLLYLEPNSFIGLRTRWSLSDAENWRKSNSFAGKLLAAIAAVLLVVSFAVTPRTLAISLVATLLAWATVCWWYSYRIHRHDPSSAR